MPPVAERVGGWFCSARLACAPAERPCLAGRCAVRATQVTAKQKSVGWQASLTFLRRAEHDHVDQGHSARLCSAFSHETNAPPHVDPCVAINSFQVPKNGERSKASVDPEREGFEPSIRLYIV